MKPQLLAFLMSIITLLYSQVSLAQTFNDGPMTLEVRVTEVRVDYRPDETQSSDFNLSGSLGGILGGVINVPSLETDEVTCNIWARDNTPTWQQVAGCLQGNLTMANGGPETFAATGAYTFTYTGPTVPQFFDLRIEAWEDDKSADFDNLPSVPFVAQNNCQSNNFSRCTYDGTSTDCYTLFGAGVLSMSDDFYCDGNPFSTGLDYRAAGPPCQWNDHGFIAGTCPTFNYYQPRIQTRYRFTTGTACNNSIDLGVLSAGNPLSHFNSNECYTDNFPSSPGNDVFYKFTIASPIGATISLCNGNTNFDTFLYLLDNNCVIDESNDDGVGCGTESQISKSLCRVGEYFIVVDGKTAASFGTFEITVTENPNFTFAATIDKTDPSCFGFPDGIAEVNVTGGVAPLNYTWSNGATGAFDTIISGIVANTYTVTVTDNDGCDIVASTILINPPAMTVTVGATDLTCSGANDGTTFATVLGGTSPFFYSWNTNPVQGSQTAVNLTTGTFNVTVTDLNSCTATAALPATVSANNPIAITSTVTDISCFGVNDGSVSLNVTGGNPPFTYNWTVGGGTDSVGGLSPGTLDVTVFDNTGNGSQCFEIETFVINEPSLLTSLVNEERNISCNGDADGAVDLGVSGGTLPYSYNWVSGNTSEDWLNAVAGPYSVTITDFNNCSVVVSSTLTEPLALVASIVGTNSGCAGDNTGSATVNVTGGTAPYLYDWSTFETSQTINSLSGDVYSVQVEDDNGCTDFAVVTITENDAIQIQINSSNPSCAGEEDGAITLIAPSGVTYTYNWDIDSTRSSVSGLSSGSFSTTITDAGSGCVDIVRVDLVEPTTDCQSGSSEHVEVPNAFSPNGDGENDRFDYQGTDDVVNVQVQVFDRWGSRIYFDPAQVGGVNQGWDGTFNGDEAQVGTYVYFMEVTYATPGPLKPTQLTGSITLLR